MGNGGQYRGDLSKEVTHLIAHKPTGNKYSFAKQFNIRTVSIEWLQQSLERGMILEETLYDPLLPADERGRNAWVRRSMSASVLGKRSIEAGSLANSKRRLRRTASARLTSESIGIWTDLIDGSRGVEEAGSATGGAWEHNTSGPTERTDVSVGNSTIAINQNGVDLQPKSIGNGTKDFHQDLNANAVPTESIPQGLFYGRSIHLHGFDKRKTSILQDHLRSQGARISGSLSQHLEQSTQDEPDLTLLIVPHTMSHQDLLLISEVAPKISMVTDLWVECCLHRKQFVQPHDNILNTPFKTFPILGFESLIISSTAFEGIELLHLSRVVILMGATYDEFLTPRSSVLLCNTFTPNREKVKHAMDWQLPIVTVAWLWDCIRHGHRLPFDTYLVPTLNYATVSKVEDAAKELPEEEAGNADNNGTGAGAMIHGFLGERAHDSSATVIIDRPGEGLSNLKSNCTPRSEDASLFHNFNGMKPSLIKSGGLSDGLGVDSSHCITERARSLREVSTDSQPKLCAAKPDHTQVPAENEIHEPKKTAALSSAITSLLAQHQREPSLIFRTAQAQPQLGRKNRRLFGRALSNLSANSNGNRSVSIGLSRASSVDTMNTDGVGTPLELSAVVANPLSHLQEIPKDAQTSAVLASFFDPDGPTGKEDEEAKQRLQMTQLGYEDPEAETWRERLRKKMGGKEVESQMETAGVQRKVKSIGTVRDSVRIGAQSVATRTRHASAR